MFKLGEIMETAQKWEPPTPGKLPPSPAPDGPFPDHPMPGELPPQPVD